MSCFFGIMFIASVYGLYTTYLEGGPIPLDIIWWLQMLLPLIGFPLFVYVSIIGYRGARREKHQKESQGTIDS
jgi:hypothetical protein